MSDLRLGDVLDDYCVKCRRLTNHSIVSLMGTKAAKVRCRTCYSDHDYRNEQIPPSKKDLKKAALFNQVLAGASPPPLAAPLTAEPLINELPVTDELPRLTNELPPLANELPPDGPVPARPKGGRKKA
jgi:hypothetical protein